MSKYIEELEIDSHDIIYLTSVIESFHKCRLKHKRLVDLLDSGNINADYILKMRAISTRITELKEDDIEDIEDVASKTGVMAECIKRMIDEVEENARDHRKDILYMWNKLSESESEKQET